MVVGLVDVCWGCAEQERERRGKLKISDAVSARSPQPPNYALARAAYSNITEFDYLGNVSPIEKVRVGYEWRCTITSSPCAMTVISVWQVNYQRLEKNPKAEYSSIARLDQTE